MEELMWALAVWLEGPEKEIIVYPIARGYRVRRIFPLKLIRIMMPCGLVINGKKLLLKNPLKSHLLPINAFGSEIISDCIL